MIVVARVWFHTPDSRFGESVPSTLSPLLTISIEGHSEMLGDTVRRLRRDMRDAYRRARRRGLIRHEAREAAVGAALMATPCTSIDWAYVRRPSLAVS